MDIRAAQKDRRNRELAQPDEVFLVWLREGKYGDSELKAVRASESGAASWCNEHRKRERANPIAWKAPEPGCGLYGTATSREAPGDYHYFIESMPLGR